jgi:hypothetical protein
VYIALLEAVFGLKVYQSRRGRCAEVVFCVRLGVDPTRDPEFSAWAVASGVDTNEMPLLKDFKSNDQLAIGYSNVNQLDALRNLLKDVERKKN